MTDPTEQIMIARGNVSPRDRPIIAGILAQYGLTVDYTSEQELINSLPSIPVLEYQIDPLAPRGDRPEYPISDITSAEDFMLREHFMHYEQLLKDSGAKTSKGSIGRMFNYLIDGDPTPQRRPRTSKNDRLHTDGSWVYREPDTPLGIEITRREDIDIEPYPFKFNMYGRNNFCASFAVRAGSIVDYAEKIRRIGFGNQKAIGRNILTLSSQLERQFT